MSNFKMNQEIVNQQGQLLKDKVALIYGATGAVASQVAREFSHEGGTVFQSGSPLEPVEKVSGEVRDSNGKAEAAIVNSTCGSSLIEREFCI
jgi:NADP-dependent 3-hydroxy acid dehydrogenase YdfG